MLRLGVEFGARMITIDSKQIKLQIWDTVSLYAWPLCHCLANKITAFNKNIYMTVARIAFCAIFTKPFAVKNYLIVSKLA